jgi:hypothetical protein
MSSKTLARVDGLLCIVYSCRMEPRGTLNGPCNLLISHSTQLLDGASRDHIYQCALYPSTNGVVGIKLHAPTSST